MHLLFILQAWTDRVLYWQRARATMADAYKQLEELEANAPLPLSVLAVSQGSDILSGISTPKREGKASADDSSPHVTFKGSRGNSGNSRQERSATVGDLPILAKGQTGAEGKTRLRQQHLQGLAQTMPASAVSLLHSYTGEGIEEYEQKHAHLLATLAFAKEENS
jgi:hypothetical protein